MDATDALGAAYCHFLQMDRPETNAKHYSSWKDFAQKNQARWGNNGCGPSQTSGCLNAQHIKKYKRDAKDY